MKNILGKISSIIYVLVVLGLIGVAFLNFNPQISFFDKLRIRALVVKSGSMEPAIKAGSLVFTKQMESYQSGEIITFKNPLAPKELITHRLFKIKDENGQEMMITKGDANRTEDLTELTPYHIAGKVFLALPYLGYLVHYSRQPVGIIVLVAVPAFLVVLVEILKIREEAQKIRKRKKASRLEKNLTTLTVIFACFISLSTFLVSESQAKLFDLEKASVTLTMGTWSQPKLSCYYDDAVNNLFFKLENLADDFRQVAYELTYQSGKTLQGVRGESELEDNQFGREIFLGTCSEDGCLVHQDISDLKLDVLLTDLEGRMLKLETFP